MPLRSYWSEDDHPKRCLGQRALNDRRTLSFALVKEHQLCHWEFHLIIGFECLTVDKAHSLGLTSDASPSCWEQKPPFLYWAAFRC